MNTVEPQASGKSLNTLLGLGLLLGAVLVLFFTSGFVFQAFKGPRSITEEELLQITTPDSRSNYVSFKPSKPFLDPGLQWGKKNNPGTKYLLLPVGDRWMLCSARIADNGPTFVGRIETASGDPEDEVISRVKGSNPTVGQRLMPVMHQTVRSIWFDTAVALGAILFLAGFGVSCFIRPLIGAKQEAAAPGGSPSTGASPD